MHIVIRLLFHQMVASSTMGTYLNATFVGALVVRIAFEAVVLGLRAYLGVREREQTLETYLLLTLRDRLQPFGQLNHLALIFVPRFHNQNSDS